ncbi:hypothetical protein AB0O32_25835 [Streptomyces rubiginosohelvolus]|uniref:hypothetical protein n=1 Tax=Streptomyces rubiginosohelvolus TaxID=67362 RepID=UPI00343BA3E6
MSRPSVDLFVAWALCCLTVLALTAPVWTPPVGTALEQISDASFTELYEQSGTELVGRRVR